MIYRLIVVVAEGSLKVFIRDRYAFSPVWINTRRVTLYYVDRVVCIIHDRFVSSNVRRVRNRGIYFRRENVRFILCIPVECLYVTLQIYENT